jgi:hypothetical protein
MNIYGFTASNSFSETITLSLSTANAETSSTTETAQASATVSQLTKGQAGSEELVMYQASADVPIHATVVVDGNLVDNTNGYKRASDLLTEAERTMPFDGVIHLTGASDGQVTNLDAAPDFKCSTPGASDVPDTRVVNLRIPVSQMQKPRPHGHIATTLALPVR